MDLGAPTAGGHVPEVRVQPIATWVWLLLGDDFNLIAHLQLVGKRHNAPTNFGTNTAMTDITMDMVSKIKRRRARR
ncbi:hypothetical protein D3C73_1237450 [compost metagenome]